MVCFVVLGHWVPVVVAEARIPEVFAPVGLRALAEPVSLEGWFLQDQAEALSPLRWLLLVQKAHLVVRFRLC